MQNLKKIIHLLAVDWKFCAALTSDFLCGETLEFLVVVTAKFSKCLHWYDLSIVIICQVAFQRELILNCSSLTVYSYFNSVSKLISKNLFCRAYIVRLCYNAWLAKAINAQTIDSASQAGHAQLCRELLWSRGVPQWHLRV